MEQWIYLAILFGVVALVFLILWLVERKSANQLWKESYKRAKEDATRKAIDAAKAQQRKEMAKELEKYDPKIKAYINEARRDLGLPPL